MTKKTNIYNVSNPQLQKYRQNLCSIELLGIRYYLEKTHGVKGAKAFELHSTYHSEPGTLSIVDTLGTSSAITIQDDTGDYMMIGGFHVTEGGSLHAYDIDPSSGKVVKIELGGLTL